MEWKSSGKPPDLVESMNRMWKMLIEQKDRPAVEFHASRCPKITSNGKELCRCGGNLLDTLIAAEQGL